MTLDQDDHRVRLWWFLVFAAGCVLVLLGAILVTGSQGADPPGETRVDLFDPQSNRTGSAIMDDKTGRIDLYDTQSRRTGYGTIDKGGRIDLYDTKSRRTGSGTLTGGGKGKR